MVKQIHSHAHARHRCIAAWGKRRVGRFHCFEHAILSYLTVVADKETIAVILHIRGAPERTILAQNITLALAPGCWIYPVNLTTVLSLLTISTAPIEAGVPIGA